MRVVATGCELNAAARLAWAPQFVCSTHHYVDLKQAWLIFLEVVDDMLHYWLEWLLLCFSLAVTLRLDLLL